MILPTSSPHFALIRRPSRRVIQDCVYLFLLLVLAEAFFLNNEDTHVYISLVSQTEERGEVFYTPEDGYSSDRKLGFHIKAAASAKEHHIRLGDLAFLNKVRFDLGTKPGLITIQEIRIRGPFGEYTIEKDQLVRKIRLLNQLEIESESQMGLTLRSQGNDPYFEVDVPNDLYQQNWLVKIAKGLFYVLAAAVSSAGSMYLTIRLVNVNYYTNNQILGRAELGPHRSSVLVILGCLLIAIGMISSRLHQSSIGMWDVYLPQEGSDSGIISGRPLSIRSDEWAVQTPWILGQIANSGPIERNNIGPSGTPLITSVPVFHISILGQPKFWGNSFLSVERAFSWMWAYKTIGLFVSLYVLFVILTRSPFYAFFGSLWVYGSSFTQWWFSSNLPEILIGFCMSVSGLFWLMYARSYTTCILAGIVLLIWSLSTVLHLYPPFIVPLFYLGVFLVAGKLANDGFDNVRLLLIPKIFAFTSVVLLFSLTLLGIAIQAELAIDLAMNTVYPGQRFSSGGGIGFGRLFSGLFEFWRVRETDFPAAFFNPSEASNYIILWPVTLIVAFVLHHDVVKNKILTALVLFNLFTLFWITLGFFEPIARITGLYLAPPMRTILGLGIGSVILTVTLAADMTKVRWNNRDMDFEILIFLLLTGLILAVGIWYNNFDVFFNWFRIISSAIVLSIMAIAVVFGRKLIFAVSVLVTIAPGLRVNPLAMGLAPLLEKDVINSARKASSANDEAKWMVLGSGIISQALSASGLRTLGGNKFIPDPGVSAILDPENRQKEIWNRYARVEFISSEQDDVRFELIQPDYYRVHIDPCDSKLRSLGITHIASTSLLSFKIARCLEQLTSDPINGIFLYELPPADR